MSIHDRLKSSMTCCRDCSSAVPSLNGLFVVNGREGFETLSIDRSLAETADIRAVLQPRCARHLARRHICKFGIE